MANLIKIDYSFRFADGASKAFNILLDRATLGFITAEHPSPPVWTELGRNRCSNCSIDEGSTRYCPVALNLARIAGEFKDYFAYEDVSVTVITEERTYLKDTTIQVGLSALVGIVMATSGCPVMEYFKPMVRFHLPFASLSETIFRMTSMHLLSQYLLSQEGKDSDFNLDRLNTIYSEVGQVNRDFAQRLSEAAQKDANANALVNLDCFASMVPLAAEDILNEMKPYFSAYLK